MKISVLVTAFNHEKFIRQAVEGVLFQQGDFELEVVVGEDRSTDGTREILEELSRRHSTHLRVTYSDRNIGANRNYIRTLSACSGEYVAMLDGDDYWTVPDKLAAQSEFLETHPECSTCFHNVLMITEDGTRPPRVKLEASQPSFISLGVLLAGNIIPTSSVMFRNRLFSSVPDWYYDLATGDWPLHVLNAEHGMIGYLDRVMGVYRVHDGGIWSGVPFRDQVAGYLDFYQAMLGYLGGAHQAAIHACLQKAWSSLADELYESVVTEVGVNEALARLDASIADLSLRVMRPNGWRSRLTGRIYAAYAFRASTAGDYESLRGCWWNAVRLDRSWLKDRGMWSILRQAVVGEMPVDL